MPNVLVGYYGSIFKMEKCDFPKCKNYDYIQYINKCICDAHWEQLCDADPKTEKRLLKKIGLVRNSSGKVVSNAKTQQKSV